jgi:hypothetical protein
MNPRGMLKRFRKDLSRHQKQSSVDHEVDTVPARDSDNTHQEAFGLFFWLRFRVCILEGYWRLGGFCQEFFRGCKMERTEIKQVYPRRKRHFPEGDVLIFYVAAKTYNISVPQYGRYCRKVGMLSTRSKFATDEQYRH